MNTKDWRIADADSSYAITSNVLYSSLLFSDYFHIICCSSIIFCYSTYTEDHCLYNEYSSVKKKSAKHF